MYRNKFPTLFKNVLIIKCENKYHIFEVPVNNMSYISGTNGTYIGYR